MSETKVCSKCGAEKPVDAYYRQRGNKDGRRGACKACQRVYDKARRARLAKPKPPPPPAGMKVCSKCKDTKSLDSFYRDRSSKVGRGSACRTCHRHADKARWARRAKPKPLPLPPGMKVCSKCRALKPLDSFHRARRRDAEGRCACCKACQRAYTQSTKQVRAKRHRTHYEANKEAILRQGRVYREANRDKIAQRNRGHYEANKEAILRRNRAYSEANKDAIAQYHRAYNEANKDAKAQQQRDWVHANPDKVRANDHRRRARVQNAEGNHTAADIRKQYKAQHGRCYYKGAHVKLGDAYHIDHVIPLSRGGSNGPENLVLTCPHCNMAKGAKLPHEWPEGGRLL